MRVVRHATLIVDRERERERESEIVMTFEAPGSPNDLNNFTEIPLDVDTSQFLFPVQIWGMRPVWEVVVKVATLAPVVMISLIGNGCLIHAIFRNKTLHTTTNLFILNMAFADFGISLLCPGMFICIDIFQNYILHEIGCKFDGFLLQAMTLVAVFSLSAVSYDRVCAIVLNCSGKLSIRNARILMFVSWIIALALAVPLAFFRKYYDRPWKNYVESFCTETITAYPYWHMLVGLSVWTPLAIMAVCYTTIFFKLDRYETQALKSKHPIVVKYKGRVARILSLVVLSFTVCRVPFTALVIKRAHMNTNPEQIKMGQASSMYVLWYASRYLVFVNAALNPLLYGCTSGILRQELVTYPPLSWLISRFRSDHSSKPYNQAPIAHERLKPRSPCIRLEEAHDNNCARNQKITNISPSVKSKSESRIYKKLRISSIVKARRNVEEIMKPSRVAVFAISAIVLSVLTDLAFASKGMYSRAVVESCRGCQLNRLPDVKAFIFEDLPLYDNAEFKHIQGAPPELVLYDHAEKEIERFQIGLLTREECNELMYEKGFKKSKPIKDEI
ncbi:hypothetical protein TSAR_004596 [Trichomalopsis sarcophagae]|uniref:G-protein coupled receptors family 1 profile domain-containing protein n=1 Tax=Trichomalopsis sarcophagae TaxID=543379 RepID=A0A232EWZ3_9HYME|nr:hypothetical protein TSAR_004596 [Trichomalopsis sarcophagae]